MKLLIFAAICCATVSLSTATPEGALSVKLTKKPLVIERTNYQRQNLHDKYALGRPAHTGEVIPLNDLLDAQVRKLCTRAIFYSFR